MALYITNKVQKSVNYRYWFILSAIDEASDINGYCIRSNNRFTSRFKGLTNQQLNKYLKEMVLLGYIEKYTKRENNGRLKTAYLLTKKTYDMFVSDGITTHEQKIPDGYKKSR